MTSLVSQATICFVNCLTFICISVYLLSVISGNRLSHYVVHFDCYPCFSFDLLLHFVIFLCTLYCLVDLCVCVVCDPGLGWF